MKTLFLALLLSGGLAACAHPLPTETSSSAIRGAEEAGADDVPRAALHVQLAKEEESAAKALNDQGDADEGASMLLRSTADAELAVVLARAEAAQVEAAAASAKVDALKAKSN